MSNTIREDDTAGKHTHGPFSEVPDEIWAWPFAAEKQDDMMQGGWTAFYDRRELKYVRCTPARAAAPDMLPFARIVASLPISDVTPNNIPVTGVNGVYITHGDVRAARAAIAKATGGKQ